MSTPDWFKAKTSAFQGQLLFGEPLAKHTYYRIGGPATVLAIPQSVEDLKLLAAGIRATGTKFYILGLGSNLLVSDQGFDGLVIKTSRIDQGIEVHGDVLRTGASVAISSLLRKAGAEGWGGIEFLTGIPGSVGGAVYMNAGTHLGESSGALKKVWAFDLGSSQTLEFEELKYEYRKNHFLVRGQVVTRAEWKIKPTSAAEVKKLIDETLARRKASQPIDYLSCGSVFKNPNPQTKAWQVIDSVGLRGKQIGQAQIAEKHSNFIINLGGAKAADVKALIDLAKKRADEELHTKLEEEVQYLGDF